MAETYCGKSCAECAVKENMNCSGCKNGPGRTIDGDCELARCCRTKGHETCYTCGFKGNCGTLRSRDWMPDNRRRKQEIESKAKAEIARRVPILGKWLWILFWMVIPSTVAGILDNDTVMNYAPKFYSLGRFLNVACSIVYGGILLKLSENGDDYFTAGIYTIAAAVLAFVTGLFPDGSGWTVLISILTIIVGLSGEYHEFMAHSDAVSPLDKELYDKWNVLWKWNIGAVIALIASILMILIFPILGILISLGAVLASSVVGIVKLVYLYRTAKIFRDFQSA